MVTVPSADTYTHNYIRLSRRLSAPARTGTPSAPQRDLQRPDGWPLAYRAWSQGHGPAISGTAPHIITSIFTAPATPCTSTVSPAPRSDRPGTSPPPASASAHPARVGYLGDYWYGEIAEVVIYDRGLTAGERMAIEAYLTDKWLGTAPPPAQTWTRSVGTVTVTDLQRLVGRWHRRRGPVPPPRSRSHRRRAHGRQQGDLAPTPSPG